MLKKLGNKNKNFRRSSTLRDHFLLQEGGRREGEAGLLGRLDLNPFSRSRCRGRGQPQMKMSRRDVLF